MQKPEEQNLAQKKEPKQRKSFDPEFEEQEWLESQGDYVRADSSAYRSFIAFLKRVKRHYKDASGKVLVLDKEKWQMSFRPKKPERGPMCVSLNSLNSTYTLDEDDLIDLFLEENRFRPGGDCIHICLPSLLVRGCIFGQSGPKTAKQAVGLDRTMGSGVN